MGFIRFFKEVLLAQEGVFSGNWFCGKANF